MCLCEIINQITQRITKQTQRFTEENRSGSTEENISILFAVSAAAIAVVLVFDLVLVGDFSVIRLISTATPRLRVFNILTCIKLQARKARESR